MDTLFNLLLVIQPVTLLLHHLNFFRLGCNFPLMVDFPIYIRWSLGIFYRCMDRDQSKSIASGRAHNLIKLGFVTNSLLVVRLLVASQDQFPCLNFYWLAGPVEMDWESVGRGLSTLRQRKRVGSTFELAIFFRKFIARKFRHFPRLHFKDVIIVTPNWP